MKERLESRVAQGRVGNPSNGVEAAHGPLLLLVAAGDPGGLGVPPVIHSAAPGAGQCVLRGLKGSINPAAIPSRGGHDGR